MIKSIFKQIWNQRKSNLWILSEMIIVLVLLWYGIDMVYNYEGAAMQPKGFDTENVFDISFTMDPNLSQDSVMMSHTSEYMEQVYKLIGAFPGVESECYYHGCVPYTTYNTFQGYAPHTDSTNVVNCFVRYISPDFIKVFKLNIKDGEFDSSLWKESEYPQPVIASTTLSDSLFNWKRSIGKTCFNPYFIYSEQPQTNYKIMAVAAPQKTDEYQRYSSFMYLPISSEITPWNHIAIRVNPGDMPNFRERFLKEMQSKLAIGPLRLYDISSYSDMKEAYDIEEGTSNYLFSTYAMIGFFIFNIFLGMLGTFWLRTRKRRGEIALRMALGSTRKEIFSFFVSEGLLLLLIAAIPALIISLNLLYADLTIHTLMDVTTFRFIFCFIVSLILLAIMIILGILFPALKAMKIEPADALHEE